MGYVIALMVLFGFLFSGIVVPIGFRPEQARTATGSATPQRPGGGTATPVPTPTPTSTPTPAPTNNAGRTCPTAPIGYYCGGNGTEYESWGDGCGGDRAVGTCIPSGARCPTNTQNACTRGSACDGNTVCVLPGSLPNGWGCTTNSVCQSNYCNSDVNLINPVCANPQGAAGTQSKQTTPKPCAFWDIICKFGN